MNYSDFISKYAKHPVYKTPTGSTLNCKSWQTEAPLRMLLNNLNAEVAENPDKFVVYGGIGQAVRNRESLEKIVKTTKSKGVTCSLCGQAPSFYPELTQKLVEWGITSVSVSPDMIDTTREIIAGVEEKLGIK